MDARTCLASNLIGRGRSVPPPRPDCALALAEMPGRPRCAERVLGCLGPGRLGELRWGSGSLEAAGEEAAWRGSTRAEACGVRGSRASERAAEVVGGALLISGAHCELCSRRPQLQPVGWLSCPCGPSRGSRREANACRNCPFDCSFRPSPQPVSPWNVLSKAFG